MPFIYELRYNDKPFYIGISNIPKFRYQQHIYDSGSIPYYFIRYMIHCFSLYPTIHILHYTDDKMEGLRREQSFIDKRLNEGIRLMNTDKIILPNVRLKYSKVPISIYINLKKEEEQFINKYEQQNNN